MNNLKLIITGDDFCYNEERDEGIVECLKKGAITRTSLMVNARNSKSVYLSKHLDCIKDRIGLHFNITEGRPLGDVNDLCSIIGEGGHFFNKEDFLQKCKKGDINPDEVRKEFKLQLEKFKEITKDLPLYIDGHQHVHVFPVIRGVVSSEMRDCGVGETRIPFQLPPPTLNSQQFIDKAYPDPTLSEFLYNVTSEAQEAARVYEADGIKFASYFMGLCLMGSNMAEDRIKDHLVRISSHATHDPQTVELMCHPGYPCRDPVLGGCGEGADDFAQSQNRLHELRVLTGESLMAWYEEVGVERVRSCTI